MGPGERERHGAAPNGLLKTRTRTVGKSAPATKGRALVGGVLSSDLERPQRHLGSLAFLADASTHEEILLPIWPDVCHYDGWSPNISARDRVPTVAKSVDFAPRDYRKPARWGQTN